MVWVGKNDGVDDYGTLSSANSMHSNLSEFTVIFRGRLKSAANFALWGRSGDFNNYILVLSSGTVRVRYGGSLVTGALTFPVDTVNIHELKITRSTSGEHKFYLDGNLEASVTNNINNTQTCDVLFRSNTGYADIDVELLELYDAEVGGNLLFGIDATTNSHVAGTPIWTDNGSLGLNVTMVNTPTDGSYWEDLAGGSGVTVTANFSVSSALVAGGSVNIVNNSNSSSLSDFNNLNNVSLSSSSNLDSSGDTNNILANIVSNSSNSNTLSDYNSSLTTAITVTSDSNGAGNIASNSNVYTVSTTDFSSQSAFNSLINVISAGEILATVNFNVNNDFNTTGNVNTLSTTNIDTVSDNNININSVVDSNINEVAGLDSNYSGITVVNLSNDTIQTTSLELQGILPVSLGINLSSIVQYDNLVTLSISGSSVNSVNSIFTSFGIVGTFNPLLSASISVIQDTNTVSIYYITNTIDIKEVTNTITINNS